MKKIIVLTSMRTGSTWLCFILQGLLNRSFEFAKTLEEMDDIWNRGNFVKSHKFLPEEVFEKYQDAYIISVVRNPKDRTSSQIFFNIREASKQRINKLIKKSEERQEEKQLSRMWTLFSTKNFSPCYREPKYIWTAYEWMAVDAYKEVEIISKFLKLKCSKSKIKDSVDRANAITKQYHYIRKGRVGSWKEEKFRSKLDALDTYQKMYYNKLGNEKLLDDYTSKK